MNTNSNVYTVIYTTLIVVVVAAVLALASSALKPMQNANIQAETISQMLAAAQFDTKDNLAKLSNDEILAKYTDNIKTAFTIDAEGNKVNELETEGKIELADNLKAANNAIKNNAGIELPVYVFNKDGQDVNVIPVYGAGLWGPVWGYFAFDANMDKIIGAYFDHEGETPGLGAKIKDEPWFRESFVGKSADFSDEKPFSIIKGGAPEGKKNAVDAITGATMTCKGLDEAIAKWFEAYKPFFEKKGAAAAEEGCCCCGNHDDGQCDGNCNHEGEHQCKHEGEEHQCNHEGEHQCNHQCNHNN
jgi:NADH:ubiquinone oxidoreductase, Na(+)-translocating, C subunit